MDALIVIFLSGLLSLFVAFAKKPILVLLTASAGLITAAILLMNQWNHPYTLFDYKGLEFTHSAISFSLVAILFTIKALRTAAAVVDEAANDSFEVFSKTETVALIRTASGITSVVPVALTVM